MEDHQKIDQRFSFTLNWTRGDDLRSKVASLSFSARKSLISKVKACFERELEREVEKMRAAH